MSTLAGTTVVVTRSLAQSTGLIAAIEEAGGVVVHVPLLQIIDAEDDGVSLREHVSALTAQDWLVVLSPNGARRLPVGGTPAKVAAIASGTAAALVERGYDVDLVPATASSVGLLAAFAEVRIEGTVLIAQAEHGRRELADGLRARGVDAAVVVPYRNVMPPVDAEKGKAAADADLVVFASPSAVERYTDNVGRTPKRAVCIGEVTAATATERGFAVTVAESPTVEAIVDALAAAR